MKYQSRLIAVVMLLGCSIAHADTQSYVVPEQFPSLAQSLDSQTTVPSAFSPKMFESRQADRVDTRLMCEGCGTCLHPDRVTIPCEGTKGWSLGFTAFMQEATSSVEAYARRSTTELNLDNQPQDVLGYFVVEPNFDYAYEIEGSYFFGTGNDIRVTYGHGDQLIADTVGPFVGSTTFYPRIVSDFALASFDTVYGNIDYFYNTGTLDFGQRIDAGRFGVMRVHAGFDYAQIDYTKNMYGFALPIIHQPDTAVVMHSEFEGVGPAMGLDLNHYIASGFSVFFRSNLAMLIGNDEVAGSVSAPADDYESAYSFERRDIVVPAMDLRAGAQIVTRIFSYGIMLEGGYRFADYYNALQFVRGVSGVKESFMMQGPYLTARIDGDY